MFPFLKNHPFAVEAFFESSLVLTFAVPIEELYGLIPDCLTLEIYEDKWAFIAVAMVQTKDLRPQGFPKILGNDFFLIGYRIYVRYTNERDKRMKGLYILKSETDKKSMNFLGNIFTHYNYSMTDVQQKQESNQIEIKYIQSNFNIKIETDNEEMALPPNSPFEDWKDARRYTGPLPFTFTYKKTKKEVLIIEGSRKNWKPKLVKILDYNIPFLNELKLEGAVLACAFLVQNAPYYWHKGRIEKWKR